jgi:hypothetical protein
MTYRHTQPGTLTMFTCLFCGGIGAAIAWHAGQWPASIVLMIVLFGVAILFSSLTVEVSDDELRWYFGPGVWTYRLPLAAIESVSVVRNHWWNGYGIRMAPGFRLYNVSGLDAVELHVGSGDVRRIGTDDPQGLAQALAEVRR